MRSSEKFVQDAKLLFRVRVSLLSRDTRSLAICRMGVRCPELLLPGVSLPHHCLLHHHHRKYLPCPLPRFIAMLRECRFAFCGVILRWYFSPFIVVFFWDGFNEDWCSTSLGCICAKVGCSGNCSGGLIDGYRKKLNKRSLNTLRLTALVSTKNEHVLNRLYMYLFNTRRG
jgi:hypothetical protein